MSNERSLAGIPAEASFFVKRSKIRKLGRGETDLRWTMMLVGAQFVTIIGTAIATLVGG